ncbi:imidazole glycerol phosphate synthase subunit HisH [Albibacterium sp.]|uniref:imidazole glycerol phosphate synthase subunit HisH n=1 Tax=Albibacterium sp. TaxID=2952885 RepID=UPI002BADF044|nr:imidazole glycerol phosphate synthase subunit HisH [Albibacterium sp.]HUH18849.1 imidazole glycerol phosphate synthase subunit HisH [Albibacterium sp.]
MKEPSSIGIVNYGAGNIFSLTAALKRQGLKYGMVNKPAELDNYDRIIIPGVGHAAKAMEKLKASGMVDSILQLKKPVLGICLGMQLLTDYSEEGNVDLLKLIPLKTLNFENRINLKVPHMGWNTIKQVNESEIMKGIPAESYFYFVHSFYIEYNPKFTVASCNYGALFSAIVQNKNFYGVQFHPEKSGDAGELILKNFSTI